MTTLAQARERIYESFVTAWGVTSAYSFDNETADAASGTEWVRLAVRHNASNQETLGGIGNRKYERIGSVFVQCFTPLDKGLAAADNLAAAARAIFEGKTLAPAGEAIHFFDVVVREIGPDGAWYQVNVEAFFTYHETK